MYTVLIADDHDLVRDTIAAYLRTVEDFNVLTASHLEEALDVMGGDALVDLVILDYNMPGMNGLDGIKLAQDSYPKTKVALMSGVASRDVAKSVMDGGADGFLPKSLTASSLVNAIRFLLSGERYIPLDFDTMDQLGAPSGVFEKLSRREMQTLEQLCQGLSNKEIARKLDIQEVTVKLHVKNLLTKLGVANRTKAALMAKEHNVF